MQTLRLAVQVFPTSCVNRSKDDARSGDAHFVWSDKLLTHAMARPCSSTAYGRTEPKGDPAMAAFDEIVQRVAIFVFWSRVLTCKTTTQRSHQNEISNGYSCSARLLTP